MTTDKTEEETEIRFYQNPTIRDVSGRDEAVYLGNLLHTLATLFGRSSAATGPDALFLVETASQSPLRAAAESMAAQLHVPLIIADAEFGIDEVMGTPVGRIESTGDSLFRKIAETPPGVLVVESVDHMRPNNAKIFNHLVAGKNLQLPDLDKPVDLRGWKVVVSAPQDAEVDPVLKKNITATIDPTKWTPNI
jgi:hypothetical protein